MFKNKCQKCHGPAGSATGPTRIRTRRGHGPDQREPRRQNPDGVVFYKVWNGRKKPKMPAFKDELNEEQIWAVVAYVQTLRKKP